MKDLIEELRNGAMHLTDIGVFDTPVLLIKAANALERLTAGDVELPHIRVFAISDRAHIEIIAAMQDYGFGFAARAVLAERERCAGVIGEAVRKW
jgi:hypothetical protein